MMRTWLTGLLVLVLAGLGLEAAAAPGDEVLGTWVTEGGKSRVEITKEKNGTYTATILWLKEKVYPAGDDEAGVVKHDRFNPDEKLRDKPIIGLKVAWGFQHQGKGYYKKGSIYDPENGKTYSCKMTLVDEDHLDIRGYIGISLIGRTTTWERYVPEEDEAAEESAEEAGDEA